MGYGWVEDDRERNGEIIHKPCLQQLLRGDVREPRELTDWLVQQGHSIFKLFEAKETFFSLLFKKRIHGIICCLTFPTWDLNDQLQESGNDGELKIFHWL